MNSRRKHRYTAQVYVYIYVQKDCWRWKLLKREERKDGSGKGELRKGKKNTVKFGVDASPVVKCWIESRPVVK